MTNRFWHIVRIVAAVHVGVLLLIVGAGWLRSCRREEPLEHMIPVDFLVDVTPAPVAPIEELLVEPPPEEASEIPEPVPVPKETPKKKPREKPKIEKGRRVVRQPETPPPGQPKLTPEQIRQRLLDGAKPSNRTTAMPDEDTRCLEAVRLAFYDAWVQPSRAEAGDAVAEGEIRLGSGGTVLGRRLSRTTGNPVLDASVTAALNAVSRIHGLTDGFIERHKTITIAFKVQ